MFRDENDLVLDHGLVKFLVIDHVIFDVAADHLLGTQLTQRINGNDKHQAFPWRKQTHKSQQTQQVSVLTQFNELLHQPGQAVLREGITKNLGCFFYVIGKIQLFATVQCNKFDMFHQNSLFKC